MFVEKRLRFMLYIHFRNCAGDEMYTKDKGGPYDTPFVHADEVEQSWWCGFWAARPKTPSPK